MILPGDDMGAGLQLPWSLQVSLPMVRLAHVDCKESLRISTDCSREGKAGERDGLEEPVGNRPYITKPQTGVEPITPPRNLFRLWISCQNRQLQKKVRNQVKCLRPGSSPLQHGLVHRGLAPTH